MNKRQILGISFIIVGLIAHSMVVSYGRQHGAGFDFHTATLFYSYACWVVLPFVSKLSMATDCKALGLNVLSLASLVFVATLFLMAGYPGERQGDVPAITRIFVYLWLFGGPVVDLLDIYLLKIKAKGYSNAL